MILMKNVLAAVMALVPSLVHAQVPLPSLFDSSLTKNPTTGALGVTPASPTQLGGVTVSTGLASNAGALSVLYGRAAGTAVQGNDPAIAAALSALQPTQAASPSLLLANGTTVSLGNLSIAGGAINAPVSTGSTYEAGAGLALNSGTFSLAFATGVTPPAALPKVAATGSYADLSNLPTLLSIGTAAGQARDAAAAITAEGAAASAAAAAQATATAAATPTAVSAAVGAETSRAELVEGGLEPKTGTVAGLPLSINPTTAQLSSALGLGTAAGQATSAFDLAGAATSAVATAALKANNLSDLASPAIARSNLGLSSAATQPSTAFDAAGAATAALASAPLKANNLSDLPSAATARTNLGLGTAATAAASAFDPAGAASNEQQRAQAVEAGLVSQTALFAGLQLGSAPTAAQLATALNAITATAGDTTHLVLANGTTVALGNLSVSNGALNAPVSSGATYNASGSGITLNSGVFALAFPNGVTAPSVLPKVAATGNYSDLAGLPSLNFDASGAAAAIGAKTVAGIAISSSPTTAQIASAIGAVTSVTSSGPISVGGTAAAPVVSLTFGNGVTAPSALPKVVASGSYSDLANLPTLGSAASQATSAFDAAGAATSALASAPLKSNNLSDLANISTARSNLGLGSAATAATTAFDAAGTSSNETTRAETAEATKVSITAGDTTHLILGNGTTVGLGNLTVSSGAIVAPSGGATYAGSGPVTISGSTISLAFPNGVAAPSTLAKVAASGAYGDLSGLPTLGSAASASIGTAAGTVAAGNDSRIVAGGTALQPNAIPSATTAQLYAGTGTAGSVTPVSLGSNLSMSNGTLNATGGGGSATPGGTNAQLQYNNSGAFGGLTLSGDATLATSGALTVSKLGGVAVSPLATATVIPASYLVNQTAISPSTTMVATTATVIFPAGAYRSIAIAPQTLGVETTCGPPSGLSLGLTASPYATAYMGETILWPSQPGDVVPSAVSCISASSASISAKAH